MATSRTKMESLYRDGVRQLYANNFEAAFDIYSRCIDINRRSGVFHIQPYIGIARIHRYVGRVSDALSLLSSIEKYCSRNENLKLHLYITYAKCYGDLFKRDRDISAWNKAEDYLARVPGQYGRSMHKAWNEHLLSNDDYDRALSRVNVMLEDEPDDIEYRTNKSEILALSGDVEGAREIIKKLKPDIRQLIQEIDINDFKYKRFIINILNTLVRSDPEDRGLTAMLSDMLRENADIIVPHPGVYMVLANAYAKQNDPLAMVTFKTGLKKYPAAWNLLLSYANYLLVFDHNGEDCKSALEKIIHFDKTLPACHQRPSVSQKVAAYIMLVRVYFDRIASKKPDEKISPEQHTTNCIRKAKKYCEEGLRLATQLSSDAQKKTLLHYYTGLVSLRACENFMCALSGEKPASGEAEQASAAPAAPEEAPREANPKIHARALESIRRAKELMEQVGAIEPAYLVKYDERIQTAYASYDAGYYRRATRKFKELAEEFERKIKCHPVKAGLAAPEAETQPAPVLVLAAATQPAPAAETRPAVTLPDMGREAVNRNPIPAYQSSACCRFFAVVGGTAAVLVSLYAANRYSNSL